MTRLWIWLERNSSQLQGLAAVAGIIAALAAVPYLFSKWVRPELTIRVTADSPVMPPALEVWIKEAMLVLRTLPEAADSENLDPYQDLRELQRSGPLAQTRGKSWSLSQPSRLRVEVANEADRVVQGIRLRLDRAYPAWGVTLGATFLTAAEVAGWESGMAAEMDGPTIVLPELPPLPPRSAVTVFAYGSVEDAVVSATVPGTSFKLIRTVPVEDRGLIAVILRPYWLPLVAWLVFLAIMAALSLFGNRVWRRARRSATYDLACSEAKAGRTESALALLQEAVAAGYGNFDHMRKDQDLEGLREMDAFKKLVGDSVRSRAA